MSQTLGRPTTSEAQPVVHDGRSLWVAAFAIGVLIDAVHFAEPTFSLYSVATFAAAGVVLHPASRGRLVFLGASLGAATLWYLPEIWNHWVLVGVLGTTIAIWGGWRRFRDGADAPSNAALVERAAPFLRTAFLLTFAFAAFAKLNEDFLDAATSCALWIVERVPGVPVVPDVLRPAVVAGALGVELLIPALLLFRRTRMLGIAIAWVFHLATAVAGHAAFAGFAWAFYLLFLPQPVLKRTAILAREHGSQAARRIGSRVALPRSVSWIAFGASWLALIAVVQLTPFEPAGRAARLVAALLYAVWAVTSGRLVLRAYREARVANHEPQRTLGYWAVGAGPAVALGVIVASAAAPYLGFKTQYSLTMYSDLRTEAGVWNHLVVPEAVKVGSWQDDVVIVTSTSDRELASHLRLREEGGGVAIPLLEARRLSHRFPDALVAYRYDDVDAQAVRFADDPLIGEDLPWIARKVARFRPVVTPPGDTCQH